VAGRAFTDKDERDGARVAIVNQILARRLWPNGNAAGGFLRMDEEPKAIQVIGIARDAKYLNLVEPPQPFVYLPLPREGSPKAVLHLRTMDPAGFVNKVRQEIRRIGGGLPTPEIRPAAEIVDRSLWAPRSGAVLLSLFGTVAVAIATIGIFGVAAYSVSRRRFEIGLRMALGARRASVIGLIMRRGMALIGFGVAVGSLISLSISYWIGRLMPLTSADELFSLLIAVSLFSLVGFLANLLPAMRAAQLDPSLLLRNNQS
jgi:hypothetical protein